MRSSFLLSTALIALSAAPAFAAAPASPNNAELVVVTATRTPQDAARTGASIDVLTAADLKIRQTVVLSDALAQIPGVTVARNGGIGQVTTVFTRGASSRCVARRLSRRDLEVFFLGTAIGGGV